MDDLSQRAISYALKGEWEEALKINLQILKTTNDSENVDVLNRVVRAYSEIGETKKALNIAKKVLKLDPFNTIAIKAVERLSSMKDSPKPKRDTMTNVEPCVYSFLEEPGKTKIVTLLNVADNSILLGLDCGDQLKLSFNAHKVTVTTFDDTYLGRLPDDLSYRLTKLYNEGNIYQAIVKSSKPHELKVFLREMQRAAHVKHIFSFPTEKIQYVAFTPPEIVHNQKSSASRR